MSGLLTGKVVLVTGAAAGIGRAIALAAGREGAAVIAGDVDDSGLAETAAQLARAGAESLTRHCDVLSFEQIEALVQAGRERFSGLDVVYANAGIDGPLAPPWEYSEADFERVINVNVNGTFRTFKAVLPGLLAQGSGSLVATASIGGLIGAAGVPAYVASKHAVVGLVKSTAVTVAAQGVRVNALCPGTIKTAMYDRMTQAEPQFEAMVTALTPAQRVGTPEEVAEAAVWLGSDRSGFVTGQALAIDGGFVAQ